MWAVRLVRERSQRRLVAIDVVLAVAFAAIGVLTLVFHEPSDPRAADPSVGTAALVALIALPLALRRRFPVTMLVITSAASLAASALLIEAAQFPAVVLCLYLVASQVPDPRRSWVLGSYFVVTTAAAVWLVLAVDGFHDGQVIPTAISFVAAAVIGDNVRRRRERRADRRAQEEAEIQARESRARQQVLDERARIARELHDVVAHSVSVMVIQAGAARRQLTQRPDQAAQALATIESTGRTAMQEMRRLLGVLRTEGSPELLPQPGFAALRELVTSDDHLPVSLTLDLDAEVPQGVEVNAYRVVQESLTNVRRHAGAVRHVDVRIARSGPMLSVEVSDDGRGAAHSTALEPGFGLIGMRERVTAYGGVLTAGPRPGGGWTVRATFPLGAPS